MGRNHIPFLFIIDFEMVKPRVYPLANVPHEILFDCNGRSNYSPSAVKTGPFFRKDPITKELYEKKFKVVANALANGNSYLTNLTIKTRLEGVPSLKSLFLCADAPYKLLVDNSFLVFSPETFIRIAGNKIFTYPMKGTIDAEVENAREKILADEKELAEHVTIVDLLRNDLSMIADDVSVTRFRYIEEIATSNKRLLQVSSEITGTLNKNPQHEIGSILAELLPAGSVSGAPKKKTLEIIRDAEGEKRGYYTGVFGIFDGNTLDSAVMIRYIEKSGDEYFYRSGGGITTQSNWQAEYQEAIDKIYVPLN